MQSSSGINKIKKRPIHGVLLLNKPLGLTSQQAVQKVKRLLGAEKAGHTGTLDPLATGVLPICLGAATKFSQTHLEADKSYEALLQLGLKTSTADAEGEVIEQMEVPAMTQADFDRVTQQWIGRHQQTPPMYCALKKEGKPLYEYARQGIEVERKARQVHIYDLKIEPTDVVEVIRLQVSCSKGTYIRTLGESIASALGTVGHLVGLKRTQTGPFVLSQCVDFETLEALNESNRINRLHPLTILLNDVPTMELDSEKAGRFLSGMRLPVSVDARSQALDRVQVWGVQPRAFLGLACVDASTLIPQRLLNPIEISQILQAS